MKIHLKIDWNLFKVSISIKIFKKLDNQALQNQAIRKQKIEIIPRPQIGFTFDLTNPSHKSPRASFHPHKIGLTNIKTKAISIPGSKTKFIIRLNFKQTKKGTFQLQINQKNMKIQHPTYHLKHTQNYSEKIMLIPNGEIKKFYFLANLMELNFLKCIIIMFCFSLLFCRIYFFSELPNWNFFGSGSDEDGDLIQVREAIQWAYGLK